MQPGCRWPVIVSVALVIAGCASNRPTSSSGRTTGSAVTCADPSTVGQAAPRIPPVTPVSLAGRKLKVVTSVAPLTNIAKSMLGDRVDLQGVIPEGVDSHTFEPRPETAKILAGADLVFL